MNPFVMLDWETQEEYETTGTGPLSLGALGVYTVVKGRREGAQDNDYVVRRHTMSRGGTHTRAYGGCALGVGLCWG